MKKLTDLKLILERMSGEDKDKLTRIANKTKSVNGLSKILCLYKIKKILEKWG